MQVGDLVRHRFSESGMLGVVVKRGPWSSDRWQVAWNDGRISWTMRTLMEIVDASR